MRLVFEVKAFHINVKYGFAGHLSIGRVPSCDSNKLWTSGDSLLRAMTTQGIL